MNALYRYALLLGILLIPYLGNAQKDHFPEPMLPKRLVNDYANTLSPAESAALEDKLLQYNKETTIEIAVVLLDTLYGYDVSDYAFKLGDKWGIGAKGTSTGVLVLASMKDRKMFIATGRGMEGAIPDIIAGRIYRDEMAPEFKKGNYFLGLSNAADAIIAASRGEYTAEPGHGQEAEDSFIPILVFVIFVVIIIVVMAAGSKGGGNGGTYVSRGGADIITGSILSSILRGGTGGGGWSSGGGFGGGGGGFGGFGGGSFGGGGAGGSW